jgi:hypothetical protein
MLQCRIYYFVTVHRFRVPQFIPVGLYESPWTRCPSGYKQTVGNLFPVFVILAGYNIAYMEILRNLHSALQGIS